MVSFLWTAIITKPLYNGLILLIKTLPFFDVGIIVIIFTAIIKLILLPLSVKASKSQMEMKEAEKDLRLIKEKYKDREEQSRKTLEYYKEKGINPFIGIVVLIIQLPIIIGLYRIFLTSGLPNINETLLYPILSSPDPSSINMAFLGLISVASKSMILALVAGASSYFQMSLATPPQKDAKGQSVGMQGDIARAMSTQMKYFFPIIMVFIAYSISSAVALYLITSNIFAIAQEIYIKKKFHKSVNVV